MQIKLELNEEVSAKLRERAKKMSVTASSAAKMLIAQQLTEGLAIKMQDAEGENKLVRTVADARKCAQLARFKEEKDRLLVEGGLIRPLRVFAMFYLYDRARPANPAQRALVNNRWVDFCSSWYMGVSKLEAKFGIKPGTKGGYGILLGGNPNPDWDVFSSDRIEKLAGEYGYLADEQCDEAVTLENLMKDFYSDPSRWKDGKYV